jgi:hypothetical protein
MNARYVCEKDESSENRKVQEQGLRFRLAPDRLRQLIEMCGRDLFGLEWKTLAALK